MTNARVTTFVNEVLVASSPGARTSTLVLEVLHSVQEAPPAPPSRRRRAVVIVMA